METNPGASDVPKLLIIEDDWIVAHGLREMLRAGGSRVVGVAARPEQVEKLVREQAPVLALVDINLGRGVADGIELARTVLASAGVRVVFTSAHTDDATLARARHAGARGFVVKPFSQSQIRAAIAMALAQPEPQTGRDQTMAKQLGSGHLVALHLRHDPRLATLSEREHQVLVGLLEHMRVPAIADYLGISAHTVRTHLKSVFAKLRVSSQQELLDQVIDRAGSPRPALVKSRRAQGTAPAPLVRVRGHHPS